MNHKLEITFEIRDDILKLSKEKAQKSGHTLDDLINYFLSEFVRAKKLPFDMDEYEELPPIIGSDELADRFEEIYEYLKTTDNIVYISHDSELSCVMMTQEKYDALVAAVQAVENVSAKDKQNES